MLPEIQYARALVPVITKTLQEDGVETKLQGVENRFGKVSIDVSVEDPQSKLTDDYLDTLFGEGCYVKKGEGERFVLHVNTSDKLYRNMTYQILKNINSEAAQEESELIERVTVSWMFDKVNAAQRILLGIGKDGELEGLAKKFVNTFQPDNEEAQKRAEVVDQRVHSTAVVSPLVLPGLITLLQVLNNLAPDFSTALLRSLPAIAAYPAVLMGEMAVESGAGKMHAQAMESLRNIQEQLKNQQHKQV